VPAPSRLRTCAAASPTTVIQTTTKNENAKSGAKNIIVNTSVRIVATPFCLLLLNGCAANFQPPPVSATNPASVNARESVTPAAKPMLGTDAVTEKTNELLTVSAPGNPSFQPSEMQGMHQGMTGMEGMQHEKTGATKMSSGEQPRSGKIYYTCATHPQIHQDKNGKCPICGMSLIKKEERK
jgi:Heavy metal binding domain